MSDCRVGSMVDEFVGLLSDLSDERPPSDTARARLAELRDRWKREDCGEACVPGRCPFRRRTAPWMEHHGYVNLYELVDRLADLVGPIDSIPHRDGLDAFDATWARRPGHYNP